MIEIEQVYVLNIVAAGASQAVETGILSGGLGLHK